MKKLSLLFLIITFGCSSAQVSTTNILIKYEAYTRGSFIEITTVLNTISLNSNEGLKEFELSKKQKEEILKNLNEVDLINLKNFTPPSTKSYADAALQATLSISNNGETYKTQTFDHGNPPKELKPLIDFLFKIVEL